MKLVLLRHGESQWNLENKFTGWHDVSLTPRGQEEAKYAAKQLIANSLSIKSIYTSLLNRAIETTDIVTDIIEFPKNKINYDWRLNERHYGALQGLHKSETALKYGEEQVHIWRRSFDIPPPLLDYEDKRHPRFNDKFKLIKNNLPSGESLKNVIDRLIPFWDKYIKVIKKCKGNHLIVAHSNSLRAIVKILDNLSNDDIMSVNIPTGVPLVYNFDSKFNIIAKDYLINKSQLEKKQKMIADQGKVK